MRRRSLIEVRIRTAVRPAALRRRRRWKADRGPVDEIYEFRLGLSSGGDAQVNTFGETHFCRAEELKFGDFFSPPTPSSHTWMLSAISHRVVAGQRSGLGSGSPWVWTLELLRDSGQLDLTSPVAAKWTGTKCASPSGDALIYMYIFFGVVVWTTLANVSSLTNNTLATYAAMSILKGSRLVAHAVWAGFSF